MTSEGSDGGGPGVDCSEGTIVWVRRRNGSWWPGRILGQHELAASHLLSPRSGTPVKLLGREDASVDWYNLEKSKRVKAFRCGEFDECIERVEACPGIPIKKREKYARREDAILHALELEKQMLQEGRMKTGTNSGKQSKPLKKEAEIGYSSRCKLMCEEPLDHGNLSSYIKEEFSFPEANGDIFCGTNRKVSQPFSWEEKAQVSSSMARLQNFGIQAASLDTDVKERYIVTSGSILGNQLPAFPGSLEERFDYEREEIKFSDRKTRTSESGFIEPLGKLYDQQRHIQHGFQSSAELSATLPLLSKYTATDSTERGRKDQISAKRSQDAELLAESRDSLYHPGYFSDYMHTIPSWVEYPPSLGEQDISSRFIEPDDYNMSERGYLDPDVDEEHTLFSGTSQSRYCKDDYHTSLDTDENFNSMPLPSAEASTSYHHEPFKSSSSSTGVSRWKLKGKRNDRNFSRKGVLRADDNPDGNVNFMNGKLSKRKRNHAGERSMPHGYRKCMDGLDLSEFCEKLEPPLQRHGNDYNSFWLKGYTGEHTDGSIDESDDDSLGLSLPSWEAQMLAPPRANPEVSGGRLKSYARQFPNKVRSRLTDVDIKVQASSRGEHVPLISLMSRLNGKAIVGHPIPIEKLSAGSSDVLLYRNYPSEDPASCDGNASPPSAWRTGRRSLMQRVPRLHPTLPVLDGLEENTQSESKLTPAKGTDAELDNMACKINKSTRSKRTMSGKFQMESLRRLSSSNLKMEDNHDHFQTNDEDSSSRFGIVKPVEPTFVTCVPTKVAFSRILEALRSPPCATSVQETPPELFYG